MISRDGATSATGSASAAVPAPIALTLPDGSRCIFTAPMGGAEIAAAVADANNEGGFFGLGARPRTPSEAAAMEAINNATQLQ